jgi:hypothetical protein
MRQGVSAPARAWLVVGRPSCHLVRYYVCAEARECRLCADGTRRVRQTVRRHGLAAAVLLLACLRSHAHSHMYARVYIYILGSAVLSLFQLFVEKLKLKPAHFFRFSPPLRPTGRNDCDTATGVADTPAREARRPSAAGVHARAKRAPDSTVSARESRPVGGRPMARMAARASKGRGGYGEN